MSDQPKRRRRPRPLGGNRAVPRRIEELDEHFGSQPTFALDIPSGNTVPEFVRYPRLTVTGGTSNTSNTSTSTSTNANASSVGGDTVMDNAQCADGEVVAGRPAAPAMVLDDHDDSPMARALVGEFESQLAEIPQDQENESLESFIHSVPVREGDLSFIYDEVSKGHTRFTAARDHNEARQQRYRMLNMVQRSEEEEYLREPLPGSSERPCVSDLGCEGRRLYGPPEPVTLVEHLTQDELSMVRKPTKRALCVLCKRSAVNYMFWNALAEGSDMSWLFHGHCNMANQVNEYDISQCLIAGTTETHMTLVPVAIHCKLWYAYVRMPEGYARFEQVGYKRPQTDFR